MASEPPPPPGPANQPQGPPPPPAIQPGYPPPPPTGPAGQYYPAGYPGPAPSYPFAGFWIRFVARLLDAVIIWVVLAILAGILIVGFGALGDAARATGLAVFYLLALVGGIGYFIYFWAAQNGQTLGNRLVNIRVIKTDGTPVTVGTAVLRYLGYIVDSLICGLPIGYIWAAFDSRKQAWHDKIASTYVVRVA